MASIDAAPKVADGVGWVGIEGELVVLDVGAMRVHLLTDTAALLFPLLDGEVTIGDLAEDVSEVFDLGHEAALTDILAFTTAMTEAGLLETDPAAA